ncbi:hypothetical protein GCM10011506_22990 [Marivirga lumbricoides]|uniref:HTH tetR-type domain-containing protein n=1 Tax=Marivirga lumbricoides TaxID=1046115 RepID=A0ABQ1M9K6_9BACT|nr:hypothetical protein GCM10011506_22990 [Marivirga lumbricoides]
MTETKEHIIKVATVLFLGRGFKEVTMKQLVESAGISKGAFYHYFTSKEQVFEEVVMSFFNSMKIDDYDDLSTTSLKEFYTNWVRNISEGNNKKGPGDKDNTDFNQNHYYLIFDALRLIPNFQKVIDEEINKETEAWVKIIDISKSNNEITSTLKSTDIAKLFMYLSDGLTTNLMFLNKISTIRIESLKVWDNIYSLLRKN